MNLLRLLRRFEEGDPDLPDLLGGYLALIGFAIFLLLFLAHVIGHYAH